MARADSDRTPAAAALLEGCATGAMSRRRFALSAALAAAFPGLAVAARDVPPERAAAPFVVYYGAAADPAIGGYGLAVLDGGVDPAALGHPGTTCLGYISLGEVSTYQPFYAQMKAQGLLGAINEAWPDSRYVDMRDERWRHRVVEELGGEIVAKGFDGFFLDTLDNAEYLEDRYPGECEGMVRAAADIVIALRRRWGDRPIMINRGYRILPMVTGQFDMLLGESVITGLGRDKGYIRQTPEEYRWQRAAMWAARNRDPKLHLYSLDYWEPSDRETIAEFYARERANGFVPYVSTRDLQTIWPEP